MTTHHQPSDEQIAQSKKLLPIYDIAKSLGLQQKDLIPYGHTKAKIEPSALDIIPNKKGRLILVTATSPTPAGEGKTTITIGLADALSCVAKDKKTMVAIREPSLGPVFGVKGGAAGGGYAQVVPMEEINLHFTGDFHAIGAAANLLAAMIDNHIYQGNALNIDPSRVLWRRAVDMNDRQLRHITSGQGKKTDGVVRDDGFDITVASEVMACFCLAKDLEDLKERLGRILVAYAFDDKPIFAKDLKANGAMTALLKDALKPNLVQTLWHTPALVHGGPFANIAHGCNSVIATKMAQHLADFVVTEAGFGADLGAEKFCNIKCRAAQLRPDVCVIVTTVRALKYNGGVPKDALNTKDLDALKKGLPNLLRHIDTIKEVFGLPVVVAVNHFTFDDEQELDLILKACEQKEVSVSLCKAWAEGADGAMDLAHKVLKALDEPSCFRLLYEDDLPFMDKLKQITIKVYGAGDVVLSDKAKMALSALKKTGINIDKLPVCMAKTPYSFSDDPKKLGAPTDFKITVQDITLSNGAGFLVVICGSIMKMPGLPKVPAAEKIDVLDGRILGLF